MFEQPFAAGILERNMLFFITLKEYQGNMTG
jgi:hypothetical protein